MKYEQDQPRFRQPGDVVLFLKALPLARKAQRVRFAPLPEVVAAMGVGGGRERDPRRAEVAAGRACLRYGRWCGGLDTCLTRSLVAGAMLSGHHDVVLHVGFRPGSDEVPLDGHAWLTVNGEKMDTISPDDASRPYDGILAVPFDADGRSGG
jgi:hypothetical protein